MKYENLNTMVDTPAAMRGFTLIELLVTMAVLAIVLGIAIPSFQGFVSRNQLASTTNNLVSALAMARSEAIKRASRVTVASASWAGGWQVFVDGGTVGTKDDADIPLRIYQSNSSAAPSVTPAANFSSYVSYLPSGVSTGNGGSGSGSFEVCKGGVSRVISVSNTGRVSMVTGTCS